MIEIMLGRTIEKIAATMILKIVIAKTSGITKQIGQFPAFLKA